MCASTFLIFFTNFQLVISYTKIRGELRSSSTPRSIILPNLARYSIYASSERPYYFHSIKSIHQALVRLQLLQKSCSAR